MIVFAVSLFAFRLVGFIIKLVAGAIRIYATFGYIILFNSPKGNIFMQINKKISCFFCSTKRV